MIVVDDEDRENEGDFIVSGEKITPEIVNFMITHGRDVYKRQQYGLAVRKTDCSDLFLGIVLIIMKYIII